MGLPGAVQPEVDNLVMQSPGPENASCGEVGVLVEVVEDSPSIASELVVLDNLTTGGGQDNGMEDGTEPILFPIEVLSIVSGGRVALGVQHFRQAVGLEEGHGSVVPGWPSILSPELGVCRAIGFDTPTLGRGEWIRAMQFTLCIL